MRYLWLFFLIQTIYLKAFSTITTPFEIAISTSYREDHLKWRLQQPGDPSTSVYKEKYTHMRFIQTNLHLRKISRDILFDLNGGVAFLGKNQMAQNRFNLSFTTNPPSFLFNTDAYTYNLGALAGYIIELTPDRHYSTQLAPLLGFTFDYEKIKRKNPAPNPFSSRTVTGADFYTAESSLNGTDLRHRWYGVFLGLRFFAEPNNLFSLLSQYSYHWLSISSNFFSHLRLKRFNDPSTLLFDQIVKMNGKVKSSGCHAHFGEVKLSANPTKRLSISAIGKLQFFYSPILNVDVTDQTENLTPLQAPIATNSNRKYKSHWKIFQILLEFSYFL